MGCCYSAASVPSNELWKTMPEPDQAQTYVIKKQGMFSDDYHCYLGDTASEETRQLWLNKSGSWKSGEATIDVENFYRTTLGQPNDANNDKIGQVMWHAEFVDTPQFDQHLSWGKGRHERYTGFFDGYDSDDDDEYYSRAYGNYQSGHRFEGRGGNDWNRGPQVYNKFLVKWSMSTYAKVSPGKLSDGTGFRPGTDMILNVFAKGSAVRVVTKQYVQITDYDDDHNKIGSHRKVEYDNHDTEFVDWIEYKLTDVTGNITIALWRCKGTGSSASWECPLFTASTTSGGMFSSGPVKVETSQGWDPLLGLLLAQLCSTEYCPAQLKSDFVPDFPNRNAYRYNNRPNGVFYNPYQSEPRENTVINACSYSAGVSINPEMMLALPGYSSSYFVNPPPEVIEAPPLLTLVPAHVEVGPDGLLVFVPISFQDLSVPDDIVIPPGAIPDDDGDMEAVEDDSDGD